MMKARKLSLDDLSTSLMKKVGHLIMSVTYECVFVFVLKCSFVSQ